MPDETIDPKRPAHTESELKKMQQRLVDDTVKDSFPASDPPAWTTGGSKSVAAGGNTRDVAESGTKGEAEGARSEGGELGQAAPFEAVRRSVEEHLPEARRYLGQGRNALVRPIETYPLTALIVSGAAGFALAWWIYGSKAPYSSRELPAYGKRSRYGWRPSMMSAAERKRADAHLNDASRAAGAAAAAADSF